MRRLAVIVLALILAHPASAQDCNWVDEGGRIYASLNEVPKGRTANFICEGSPSAAHAWTLDFSWSTPMEIDYQKMLGGKETYLAIRFTISNNTGAKVSTYPKIVVMADKTQQYDPGMHPLVHGLVEQSLGMKLEYSWGIGGDLYPDAAKEALSIYGPWNKSHQRVELFVEGISEKTDWSLPAPTYYLLYLRNGGKLQLVDHRWRE